MMPTAVLHASHAHATRPCREWPLLVRGRPDSPWRRTRRSGETARCAARSLTRHGWPWHTSRHPASRTRSSEAAGTLCCEEEEVEVQIYRRHKQIRRHLALSPLRCRGRIKIRSWIDLSG